MKNRILLTILAIISLVILGSCNACTSSSGQSFQAKNFLNYEISQDTIKITPDSTYVALTFTPIITQDTQKAETMVVKKVIIEKMAVDTSMKFDSKDSYDKLEKTQMDIKAQQRTLDSMLVVKKK